MFNRAKNGAIQFCFYLAASFTAATLGYYIIAALHADNDVFGSLYRMPSYHRRQPLSYIFIPCAVYSFIVTIGGSNPVNKSLPGQILVTLGVVICTILLSMPLGGMLWYYHDMQAGYFPENWLEKVINEGALKGLEAGWLIIVLSVPYNLLGVIAAYFITIAGSRFFNKKRTDNSS